MPADRSRIDWPAFFLLRMSGMIRFLPLLVLVTILSACSESPFPGFERNEDNVYYKVHHRSNDTAHPYMHSWVTLNMDYRLEDTLLFTSTRLKYPLQFTMIEPTFQGDLYDGLSMMHIGDSMTFVIVADSFFLHTAGFARLPDFVEPGSPMYYDVRLLNVQDDEAHARELEARKTEMRREEDEKLREYLIENDIQGSPTASGLYYIPLEEGYGRKPDTGDMCRVYLEVKELGGRLLYNNFEGDPIDIEYGKQFDTDGFREGLGMTRIGGSAMLIVPSPIGVGERGRELVEPFTTVIYRIHLDTIRTVEEVQQERLEKKMAREAEKQRMKDREAAQIKTYLEENRITEQPSSSGLIMVTLEKGEGATPVAGEKVVVDYIVYNLSGVELDNSLKKGEPAEFVAGKGQVIRAWDEAILKMNRGGRAKLIVPSRLAYGTRGREGMVEPYEPLVFEITLRND